MNSPPQDLVKYYSEEVLLLALKSQYPSPHSSAEAVCMQDAYTMIHMCHCTLENDVDDDDDDEGDPTLVPTMATLSLILQLSDPLLEAVKDLWDYISRFRYWSMPSSGFKFHPRRLEILDRFLVSPESCGKLYCDSRTRNARIACRCIEILLSSDLGHLDTR